MPEPKSVSHYQILRTLGSGGMGTVYLARDTRLMRDVAVKVLPPDLASDPDRLNRFEQEAQLASALNHPNVAISMRLAKMADSNSLAWSTCRARPSKPG